MSDVTAREPAEIPPRIERARLGAGGASAIIIAMVINIAVIVGMSWVALNPQRVVDQLVVWQYEPSIEIANYVDRTTMTEHGRFLFLASAPSIETEGDFDEICATQLEDVGILGCYLPDDKRIYLYDVTDDRLAGIEEVVAAHEMLHAAWDRLSDTERDRLAVLLEAEVTARADDAELQETLAFYAETEPGQRINELHSIVATEFASISEELEEYYSQFFVDRSAIIALHDASSAVFEEQEAQIEALVARLETLEASITADDATYNAGYDALNRDIDSFNARADAGDFSSQAQFDRERNALLARQAELDALFTSLDARVTEYNGLIEELDALNARITELNESINITPRSDGL